MLDFSKQKVILTLDQLQAYAETIEEGGVLCLPYIHPLSMKREYGLCKVVKKYPRFMQVSTLKSRKQNPIFNTCIAYSDIWKSDNVDT